MTEQYIRCQFNPRDRRSYTYRNDGEPLTEGDRAIVVTAKGEVPVTVVGIRDAPPEFDCKPILRRIDNTEINEESA